MSLFVLQFVTLLTLALFTIRAYGDNGTDSSPLLLENVVDIKRVDLAEGTDDRTFPRPTTPEIIFEPIPILESSKPTVVTVGKPATLLPQKPVVLPPIASVSPGNRAPICGRKGRCYQWFDNEIEVVINGYQRCSPANERLAKRYCCIP